MPLCAIDGRPLNRRLFLQLSGAAGLVACGVVKSDGGTRVPKVGLLIPGNAPQYAGQFESFTKGLADLGLTDGRNVALLHRFVDGHPDHRQLAQELLGEGVGVLVVSLVSLPYDELTSLSSGKVPIVSPTLSETLIGGSIIASLARPGGNVTGLVFLQAQQIAKRLEMLARAAPEAKRIGYLVAWTWTEQQAPELAHLRAAAAELGRDLRVVRIPGPDQVAAGVDGAMKDGVQALIAQQTRFLFERRRQLVDAVNERSLPTIFAEREYADEGALLVFGVNLLDLYRRSASYVRKLLDGARPGDLPIELPSKFDFVVNLRTARAIGLTIPNTSLVQATEVVA